LSVTNLFIWGKKEGLGRTINALRAVVREKKEEGRSGAQLTQTSLRKERGERKNRETKGRGERRWQKVRKKGGGAPIETVSYPKADSSEGEGENPGGLAEGVQLEKEEESGPPYRPDLCDREKKERKFKRQPRIPASRERKGKKKKKERSTP